MFCPPFVLQISPMQISFICRLRNHSASGKRNAVFHDRGSSFAFFGKTKSLVNAAGVMDLVVGREGIIQDCLDVIQKTRPWGALAMQRRSLLRSFMDDDRDAIWARLRTSTGLPDEDSSISAGHAPTPRELLVNIRWKDAATLYRRCVPVRKEDRESKFGVVKRYIPGLWSQPA